MSEDSIRYKSYDPGWVGNAPPFDPRFPHQNQYMNCARNYIDYHRCLKIKGEDYIHCNYFKKVYRQKCPPHYIEKWDDQMANDAFEYKL